MSILDGEIFANIINKIPVKIIDSEELFTPVNKFEIERDINQRLILTTYSSNNATSKAKNFPPGTVINNNDTLKVILPFSENEILISGISTYEWNQTHNQASFIRVEKTSVQTIEYISKKEQNIFSIIEWVDNIDNGFYLYPDSININETLTTEIKLLHNDEHFIKLSSSDNTTSGSSACIYLNIDGQELYVGKCTKQTKLHNGALGFILYKGSPSEEIRDKIRRCLSYALGRYIVYLGYTAYNEQWQWLSFKAIAGYSIKNLVYDMPTSPPAPLDSNTYNMIDSKMMIQLVNALYKHHDNLKFQHILWLYWHAVCAPIHMAAVHYGGAIEFLQDAYIKHHNKKFKTKVLEESVDWEEFSKAAFEAVEKLAINKETKNILCEKIKHLNQMPPRNLEQQFLEILEIQLSKLEKSAWKQRNSAAHGKEIENNDSIKLIKEVKILKIILDRLILKITQGSDQYIDYYSLGYPFKLLTNSISDE